MPKKIIIELNEKEAELFKWFRKHQTLWEIARQLKPGRITIHFNNSNEIGHTEIHNYKGDKKNKSVNKPLICS